MKKNNRSKLLALSAGLLLALVIGEIIVRIVGTTDVDGNFHVGTRTLRPYHFPVNSMTARLERYNRGEASIISYDQYCGWAPTPNYLSENGFYRHNAQGIRTDRDSIALQPDSGVTRIVVLGDSYIYGDEVPFHATIGYLTEQKLRKRGHTVEVLNFGVGAYGMDQAFLRFYHAARAFNPDIVVFGFQPENQLRNLGIVRAFYAPKAKVPFTKPRFIINERNNLQTVNQPTLPVEELAGMYESLPDWPMLKYEQHYLPANFEAKWWRHSRLFGWIEDFVKENRWNIDEKEQELFAHPDVAVLSERLLAELNVAVTSDNATLIPLMLPRKKEVTLLVEADLPVIPESEFIATERKWDTGPPLNQYESCLPYESLLRAADKHGLDALFAPNQHYSAKGNEAIADALAASILGELRN